MIYEPLNYKKATTSTTLVNGSQSNQNEVS